MLFILVFLSSFHYEKLQHHCMTCGKFRLTGEATDRERERQTVYKTDSINGLD